MSTAIKVIRAYVQPFVIARLTQCLLEIPHFPGMSVSDCEGFGRAKSVSGQDYIPFFAKKRIEIYTPTALVDPIIAAILLIASSDQHGDGKIFIEDVQEGIRISTRERSESLA